MSHSVKEISTLFKEMPVLLRVLVGHAFFGFFIAWGSVIPHYSFWINGQTISFADWWESGAGHLSIVLGYLFPLAGYLFLMRSSKSRLLYIFCLFVASISPFLFFGQINSSLIGIGVTGMVGWYLFRAGSVQNYFAYANNYGSTERLLTPR